MVPQLLVFLTGIQGGTIELVPGQDPADPVASAYVLVDHESNLELTRVRASPELFHRNTSGFINPGTTSGVVWLRFDMQSPADEPGVWMFALNRALVDPGEIYLVRRGRVDTLLANSLEAFARSYAEFGTLAARFEIAPRETASLYVRYRGGNWSGLVPKLSTVPTFQQRITRNLLVQFALIGGVLTLVLYTSISYMLSRRTAGHSTLPGTPRWAQTSTATA